MEKRASNTTISLEQQTLQQESVNEQPLYSTLNNSSQVRKAETHVMLGPTKCFTTISFKQQTLEQDSANEQPLCNASNTYRTCYVGTPKTDLSESKPKLSLEGTKYMQNQPIGGLYRCSVAMPSTSPLKLMNPADKLFADLVNLGVNAKFKATGIVHSLLSSSTSKAGP